MNKQSTQEMLDSLAHCFNWSETEYNAIIDLIESGKKDERARIKKRMTITKAKEYYLEF